MKTEKTTLDVDSGMMSIVPMAEGLQLADSYTGHHVFIKVNPDKHYAVLCKCFGPYSGQVAELLLVEAMEYQEPGYSVAGILKGAKEFVVGDPCYLHEDQYEDEGPYRDACEAVYDSTSEVSMPHGIFTSLGGRAVVSSTAYGDGTYDVIIKKNDDGEFISLSVDFLGEEEIEE